MVAREAKPNQPGSSLPQAFALYPAARDADAEALETIDGRTRRLTRLADARDRPIVDREGVEFEAQ